MATARYKRLGDILCKESALTQAAQALDIVAKMAIEQDDREILVSCATIWAAIADRLDTDQQDGGQEPQKMKQQKIGFGT